MPEVKIRIGAAVDQSMRTVFKPLMQAATDARKHVQKEFASISSEMKGGFVEGGRSAKRVFTDTTKAGDAMSRDLERQAAQRARAAERESTREWSAYSRAAKQALRETEKAAQDSQRSISKFAERTSHRATRFFTPNMPIMSTARRAGADVLRGVGVDVDVSSAINRNVELSKRITGLQNQASINNQDVSHASLRSSIADAADKYSFPRMEAANALGKFADKTGDMGLGQDIIAKIAERAAASGGNLDDMMDAAGDVAMNLGPVKDKAKALVDVMDAMTVQGAKGAIEMKDLARSGMSRIAANAGRFEGDAGENMKKLGALAQLARQSGGASSAAEAGTAVARLTDQFTLPARRKQFKALGVDVDSGTEKGQFADVFSTIIKTIVAADGNQEKLKKPFASSIGSKPVLALAKEYNQAGGGQAGVEAMKKLLNSFMATEDIQAKLDAANQRRDQETASKVQKFQSRLDDVTDGAMVRLLPALESLEGPALRLAGKFGDLATWAASNPWQAVAAAAGVALSRAILESGVRAAIETAITRSVAGTGINVGTASANIGVATLAVGALALAWKEADELGQTVGAKKRATDMIPGVNEGEFSFKRAAAEFGILASNPLGYLADKGGAIAGDYARSGYNTLTEQTAKPVITPGNVRMALPFRADQYEPEQRSPDLQTPGKPIPVAQLTDLNRQMVSVHTAIRELHAAVKGGIPVTVMNQDMPKAPVAGGGNQ